MTAAAALPSNKSQHPSLPWIVQQLIISLAVAAVTWGLATARMDAVQEQRLVSIEEQLKSKASRESTEELKREVLSRLDRIENKIDHVEKAK